MLSYQSSACAPKAPPSIERRLRVVPGYEDRTALAGFCVEVGGTFHDVPDHQAQSDVAVGNLLEWRLTHHPRVRRLRAASVVIGLIDVEKFRERSRLQHAIEVGDELLRAAPIGGFGSRMTSSNSQLCPSRPCLKRAPRFAFHALQYRYCRYFCKVPPCGLRFLGK
jgi:hypothetical protein